MDFFYKKFLMDLPHGFLIGIFLMGSSWITFNMDFIILRKTGKKARYEKVIKCIAYRALIFFKLIFTSTLSPYT